MEHNHINNHICNNNQKRMERNISGRCANEMMHGHEDNYKCDSNRLYEHLEYYENNDRLYCNKCKNKCEHEHGGEVYLLNVEKTAYKNQSFRRSEWTGEHLQMTLMSIPCSNEIGIEMHDDTDQYIRIEHGYALAITGCDPKCLDEKKKLSAGDAIFIPAGTWHNIVNIGRCELKLSSVYAPPHHPKCTEERYN